MSIEALKSVAVCDRSGGGGADLLVPLLLKPVGIDGAGLEGRILPFSDAGVDAVSEASDKLSTFESSEWTLTSSGYNFVYICTDERKQSANQ